ncbi:TPA: hypothetical protein R5A90_001760, partial [Campylobacter jejuni]|nr:hypothetical protein [Campylobacter jejuni]
TYAIKAGSTSENFTINGVIIGKVDYKDGDENGALVSAINAVKDTTGVQASKDENGKLVLTSADGRGIKITGDIGVGSGILAQQKENYGRLSLVKNDGRDIAIGGTNLSAIGMGAKDMISQSSVSLRESKGQISGQIADAMGFNSYDVKVLTAGIQAYMNAKGNGFSQGSGYSIGSGKNMSKNFGVNGFDTISGFMDSKGSGYSAKSGYSVGSGKNMSLGFTLNTVSAISKAYLVSKGSGFSAKSGNSQFATLRTDALGVKDETAGVTTLKGAMAVMDIA